MTMISIVDSNEGMDPCDKAGISFTRSLEFVNVKTHGSVFIPCEFTYSPQTLNGNSSSQSIQRPVPFWRVHYASGDIQPSSQTLFYGNLPLNHKYNRSGLIISGIDSRFNKAKYACCFELFTTIPDICEASNTTIIVTSGGVAGAVIGAHGSENVVLIGILLLELLLVLV